MSVGPPKDPRPGSGTSPNPCPVLSASPCEGLSPHPTARPAGSPRPPTGPSQIPLRGGGRPKTQTSSSSGLILDLSMVTWEGRVTGPKLIRQSLSPRLTQSPPRKGPYFLRYPRTRLQPPQALGLHLSDPFSQGLSFKPPGQGCVLSHSPERGSGPSHPQSRAVSPRFSPGQDLRPGRSSSSAALDLSSVLGVDITCLGL